MGVDHGDQMQPRRVQLSKDIHVLSNHKFTHDVNCDCGCGCQCDGDCECDCECDGDDEFDLNLGCEDIIPT